MLERLLVVFGLSDSSPFTTFLSPAYIVLLGFCVHCVELGAEGCMNTDT